jgi:DNA-binding IclR family transcriptional regulator
MEPSQSVARAMAILEIIGRHKALTGTKINELLGFHRSTTYRLLGTLRQLKYVRKDEYSGLFVLTPKVLKLASAVTERQDITSAARPFLEQLHEKTQETVHLAILDERELVYLDKLESTRNLRVVMSSQKGLHAPLYCTGIGKVLLAWLDHEDFEDYLGNTPFTRFTEYTLTDAEAIRREAEEIRMQGYASDREEHELGVFCVAAPIRGARGRVAAALSVSLPSVRLDGKKHRDDLIGATVKTADAISAVLS